MKLLEPYGDFLVVVRAYNILDARSSAFAAFIVPWAELVFGLFVILGLWFRRSLAVLWLLNTVFIAAVASAIVRKLSLEDCGCFGPKVSLSLPQVLLLDTGLWVVFALLMVFAARARAFSLDGYFEKHTPSSH